MPFPNQTSQPFTGLGITLNAPTVAGVYGLFKSGSGLARTWVWVGESSNIRQRLFQHLNNNGRDDSELDPSERCIKRQQPTKYVYEETLFAGTREEQLIEELDPVCNRRPS